MAAPKKVHKVNIFWGNYDDSIAVRNTFEKQLPNLNVLFDQQAKILKSSMSAQFRFSKETYLAKEEDEDLESITNVSPDIAIFFFNWEYGVAIQRDITYCINQDIFTLVLFPESPTRTPGRSADHKHWAGLLEIKESLEQQIAEEESSYLIHAMVYPLGLKKWQQPLNSVLEKIFALMIDQNSNLNKSDFLHAKSTISNFDSLIIDNFRSRLRPRSILGIQFRDFPENEQALKSLGYLKDGCLTNLGVLLFTTYPSIYFPSAYVKITSYDKRSRIREEAVGPLFDQITETYDLVKGQIQYREILTDQSVTPILEYEYPMICLRELIANAVCHRDYQINDRPTYVKIYEDFIEITNPAASFGALNLASGTSIPLPAKKVHPNYRNKRLSKVLSALNLMEGEGTGLETAVRDCERVGAPVPTLLLQNEDVTIKIFPRKDWERKVSAKQLNCEDLDVDTHYMLVVGGPRAGKTTFISLLTAHLSRVHALTTNPFSNPTGSRLLKENEQKLHQGEFPGATPAKRVQDIQITVKDSQNLVHKLCLLDMSGEDILKLDKVGFLPQLAHYVTCPDISFSIILVADAHSLEQRLANEYPNEIYNTDLALRNFLSWVLDTQTSEGLPPQLQNVRLVFTKVDEAFNSIERLLEKTLPQTRAILQEYHPKPLSFFECSIGKTEEDEDGVYITELDLSDSIRAVAGHILAELSLDKKKSIRPISPSPLKKKPWWFLGENRKEK